MSMMTTAYLLETYGARLTVEELTEVLRTMATYNG